MTEPTHSDFSRRRFLHLVGVIAGSAAAYDVALGLDLFPSSVKTGRPEIAQLRTGIKKSVIVLGAGLGGLVSAYELSRRGYDVRVFEASHRVGGRVWTVRGGDKIDEIGNPQICRFDREPHMYFNAGASRIPSDHAGLLGYCRELGVELEPFVNLNRNAWVQDDALFGGRPIRNREYMTETQSFIAELASKTIKPELLDGPLNSADYQFVIDYLRQFGHLDPQNKAVRSKRTTSEGFNEPSALQKLLHSKILSGMAYGESEDQSPVMLAPVGGMDKTISAFMKHVGKFVTIHARAESIRLTDRGVDIVIRRDGKQEKVSADFCINSIPMQLLTGLDHNFPSDYATGLGAIPRGKFFKLAFQAKERFWERENIYGGISWTMQDISQMWYPSYGIHRKKGVMLGAYTFSGTAGDKFARMTPEQRNEMAIMQGEKIHPGYRQLVEHGVSVPWHRINHMLGCAAAWSAPLRDQWYAKLQAPVGSHYLVGDQMSALPSWQEGAVQSAFFAISDIDRRVRESGEAA